MQQYKQALFRDIAFWSKHEQQENQSESIKPKLYTLYFWGGTPLLFWSQYIIDIIAYVQEKFDLSELAELSIECNPYPHEQTLAAVKDILQSYKTLSRIRFSFGIQSLDDQLLDISGRQSDVQQIVQFTQELLQIRDEAIKQNPHTEIVYNYDFIAFGKDWKTAENKWLQELIKSQQIDSFSLYTLELFPWSQWYHTGTKDHIVAYNAPWDNNLPYKADEDSLWDDFSATKELLTSWGYQRYEISNYALPGKESLHNIVYWSMKPYIWIWLGSHWYTCKQDKMWRTNYPYWWKNYINWVDGENIERQEETVEDQLIESFFLWLRMNTGISDITKYETILTSQYDMVLQKFQEEWLVIYDQQKVFLTDTGMNLHHYICTQLMEKI